MKEKEQLVEKYLDDAIKYYALASYKERQSINKLLHQINTNKYTDKQAERLRTFARRYKVLTEANHINSQSRLNKLFRKPLTSPNDDIV